MPAMSGSFEKSVKGGTKMKLAAPKSKYVEHILTATRSGEAGVAEIFRTLSLRSRDTTWTIVFKTLIISHLMIREGQPDVTLAYLSEAPSKLAVGVSDVQTQGSNIQHYHDYLMSRARSFRDTKRDWVRSGKGRLKQASVDKGLLREAESVQKQISALLKCELFAEEPENEITLTAFRLLTMDLLVLYHIMNEGTINILEHYFEMSKVDAERALAIYKTFSRQTEQVVKYLGVARQYEHATRLEIPKLKHAPTSLTASLEEYLHDPDFEINRRQYLAQQEAKRTGKPVKEIMKSNSNGAGGNSGAGAAAAAPAVAAPKAPAPDLMDFFGSIEQNQQPMNPYAQNPQAQYQYQQQQQQQQPFQNNQQFAPQGGFDSTNPFAQMMSQQPTQQQMPQQPTQQQTPQGFNQQQFQPQPQGQFNSPLSSIPQDQSINFQQQSQQAPFMTGGSQQPFGQTFGQPQLTATPTGSNPFRQSTMPTGAASSDSPFKSAPPQPGIAPQSTNPFARNMEAQNPGQNQGSPFNSAPPSAAPFGQQSQSPPPAQPMQPMRTGTNPFARSTPVSTVQSPTASPLVAQATGTNPFRQTAFINQQTGQGWQAGQGTMGGLENMNTVPAFPRPTQNAPFQPQQQQPWS